MDNKSISSDQIISCKKTFIPLKSIGDEEFIILACDGLWDTVEPFDAVQLVRTCIKDGTRDTSANKLVELAIEQRSMDNISILVVFFDFNRPAVFSTATSSEKKQEHQDETVHREEKAETECKKTSSDVIKDSASSCESNLCSSQENTQKPLPDNQRSLVPENLVEGT